MKKPGLIVAAFIVLAVALCVAFAVTRIGHGRQSSQPPATEHLVVTIGDQSFTLVNGVAEKQSAPGSSATETVRVVGEPVSSDVTGDGKDDVALLLADDPGGSGTFYYAVLAVNDGSSWHATNVVPLGDRIAPEKIEVVDGQFVYRFLERHPGDPMATTPTVQNSVPIRFDAASGRISAWG